MLSKMKLILFYITLSLTIGLSFESFVEKTTTLSNANNHFSVKLLQNLFDDHKNVFFSPFSMSSALGIVYTGADGKTAEEMAEVLGYKYSGISDQQINEQFSEVIKEVENNSYKTYELNIANKIVIKQELNVLQTFRQNVQKFFNSDVETKDFRDNPKAIMDSINEWVAKQTKDKIKTILSEPLDPMTQMVILNAIYFKGIFKEKFDKKDTTEEIFYNEGMSQKMTQTMKRTGKFRYTEIDEIEGKLLEMPYSGDDISLYIVLPNQRQGLKKLVNELKDFKVIEKYISRLQLERVVVSLPKFKVETKYDLNDNLSQMGMKSLFTSGANLSKINGKSDLYVSQVIHKAFIDVNEEGTEAAAVTAIRISRKTMARPKKPYEFIADHPFLYYIRNNRNGLVLFCGYLNTI